jgi:ribose-phosphate pyrophosphokinase
MPDSSPHLICFHAARPFGEHVAKAIGLPLSDHEERDFEDGEHKTRPLISVRDRDVYVIQDLHGDAHHSANDRLIRLLFFIGALKDAGAARVTAVVPYLSYSRKDRRTKPRDPLSTRYIAQMFEALGTDCILTMDVHNLAAYQNAFRCRAEHLEARWLFADHFAREMRSEPAGEENAGFVVVSPDAGGVKRADRFREALSRTIDQPVPMAFIEKYRSAGVVSGEAVIGDVAGRTAIIFDDLISTGGTMVRAARACRDRGAVRIHAAATHGVFTTGADDALDDDALDTIIITNALQPVRLESPRVLPKLITLDAAPLIAEAIRCLHEGGSLTELTER